MTIQAARFQALATELPAAIKNLGYSPSLIFVFGGAAELRLLSEQRQIESEFPEALVVGCTSAGEICGEEVSEERLVALAVRFTNSEVIALVDELGSGGDSRGVGARLGAKLADRAGLRHVIVLSDGLLVNGSQLVEGICGKVPVGVGVTGGLAGDGDRFKSTMVYFNGSVASGRIVAIGLYGEKLKVGYGSLGGWDPFGPERVITNSSGNKLFELDGRSALSLYKEYLGNYASQLPGAALRFPLTIKVDGVEPLVRTVLDINEAEQSITFAGDIPQGKIARFMKANLERLVDGAAQAAGVASLDLTSGVDFALLISCVGRRLVLKQRVEEEIEAVREQLGTTNLIGFYSYGEIAPFMKNAKCELHNQTMTITAFREDD